MNTRNQDLMNEMKAAGKPLHVEYEEPLSKKEQASFQRTTYDQMGMYAFLGIMLVGVPFLAKENELSFTYQIVIATAIFIGYGTLVILVFIKMRRAYRSSKRVIKGFITAKSAEQKKQNTYYSLTVGSNELGVDYQVYDHYEIGDAGVFYYFNNWGSQLLSHAKIEDSDLDLQENPGESTS